MSAIDGRRTAREQEPEASDTENGVIGIGKELAGEITGDDVPGLAAEVAYHAIFSIPALIVVVVTLAAVIDNVAEFDVATRLYDMIDESAPAATQEILRALVENAVDQVGGGAASVGLAAALLIALWAGSNGVGALLKAFNRAYNATEARTFPRKKAISVLMTIVLGLVVNLAFVLWVFGGRIGRWIADEYGMGSTFDWAWNVSRIPAGVLVIVFVLAVLYYFGPTIRQQVRWVLPGAVMATILWGALVLGFSLYLRFANPGSAYGALGGMIVFLFFLYLTSVVFLIGAELNAVLARRYDRLYQRWAREFIEDVGPGTPVPASERSGDSSPATISGLAVGAAATVGIVLAAMLGRRSGT